MWILNRKYYNHIKVQRIVPFNNTKIIIKKALTEALYNGIGTVLSQFIEDSIHFLFKKIFKK